MDVFWVLFIVVLFIILNWFILIVLKDLKLEGKYRFGLFYVMERFFFFDYILLMYYLESLFICGFFCLRNNDCVLFNFGRRFIRNGKFICELSNLKVS